MIQADQIIQSSREYYGFSTHFLGNSLEAPLIQTVSGTLASGGAVASVAGSPGIWRLDTGTTAAGIVSLRSGIALAYTQGIYTVEMRLRFPSVAPTGTEEYTVSAGFADGFDNNATNAAYIWANSSTAGNFFIFNSKTGGGADSVDTGIAITQNSWYKLKTILNTTGARHIISNDTTELYNAFFNTAGNLPNANTLLAPMIYNQKSVGTNIRQIDIDFFEIDIKL